MLQFSFINEKNWDGQWDGHNPEIDPDTFWAAVDSVFRDERYEEDEVNYTLNWWRPTQKTYFEITEKGGGLITGLDFMLERGDETVSVSSEERTDVSGVFSVLILLASYLSLRLYSHELNRFIDAENANFLLALLDKPDTGIIYKKVSDSSSYTALPEKKLPHKKIKLLWAGLCILALGAHPLYKTLTYMDATPERASRPVAERQRARTPLPAAQITVDGSYTVTRSEVVGEARNLGWVIQEDGVTVLERNAEFQMKYRYFALKPGHNYTVFLQAWHDGGYVPISNKVEFRIP